MGKTGTPLSFKGALRQSLPPMQGLASLFHFSERNVSESEVVEYDVAKDPETIPIPLKRGTGGHENETGNYKTLTRTPAYYSEKILITAKQLGVTKFGDTDYMDVSRRSKVFVLLKDAVMALRAKLLRGEEYQASRCIVTGGIDFSSLPNCELADVDYGRDASLEGNTTNDWQAAGVTFADISAEVADKVRKMMWISKLPVRDIILGDTCLAALLSKSDFTNILDNRRVEGGALNTTLANARGFDFIGRIAFSSVTLNVWSYNNFYSDPSASDPNAVASMTNFLPATGIALIADNQPDAMQKGLRPRERFHAGLDPSFPTDDAISRFIRDQFGGGMMVIPGTNGLVASVEGKVEPIDRKSYEVRIESSFLEVLVNPNCAAFYTAAQGG